MAKNKGEITRIWNKRPQYQHLKHIESNILISEPDNTNIFRQPQKFAVDSD